MFEHETYHVEHHLKPAFNDYKAAAAQLGAPCLTKGNALCLKGVILNELKRYYIERAYRDGAVWDWQDYGPYLNPEGQANAKERMRENIDDYNEAQAALSAALATCMALYN